MLAKVASHSLSSMFVAHLCSHMDAVCLLENDVFERIFTLAAFVHQGMYDEQETDIICLQWQTLGTLLYLQYEMGRSI